MQSISYFVTAARGVDTLIADELRMLGATDVTLRGGGVACSGDSALGYRVCLWSRMASRILRVLTQFPAPDADALYAGVRSVDWRDHLGPDQTLAVRCTSVSSQLDHSHYAALRVKDAIVDQLRDSTGSRPSVDTLRPHLRVHVHLEQDIASLGIDLAGQALHRRGYRSEPSEAPLKETLAAAVLTSAGWPEFARAGVPLLDPMCGSGTLLIEAALMAGDIAPGLLRDYFGFLGWRAHDAALWKTLVDQARARAQAGVAGIPPIVGHDADPLAIRRARTNLARAGLRDHVRLEQRPLAETLPIDSPHTAPQPRGLLVVNPPYGERLGDQPTLIPLYRTLGDVLKRRFPGWHAAVLSGSRALEKQIGLRPSQRITLYNGALECRLLIYPIAPDAVRSTDGPSWRRPKPIVVPPETEMFVNRLRKNERHLARWIARTGVSCFRLYDADLPEYAVAIDRYEDALHVQEYQCPSTIDPAKADTRRRSILAVLPTALGVPAENIFFKMRQRQRGAWQYERLDHSASRREVREGDLRFLVNLGDYLDTGLFLDLRQVRALVAEWARGCDVLNLYAYTGTASVYAAHGGARSTTSVDLSATYLDWAGENFRLNHLPAERHRRIRSDCQAFLANDRGRYGLIFVAPPTFSNSKRTPGTFDVQRDHVALLDAAAQRLAPGGRLVFVTHAQRFRIDPAALAAFHLDALNHRTVPPDFARTPRVHSAWLLTARTA